MIPCYDDDTNKISKARPDSSFMLKQARKLRTNITRFIDLEKQKMKALNNKQS